MGSLSKSSTDAKRTDLPTSPSLHATPAHRQTVASRAPLAQRNQVVNGMNALANEGEELAPLVISDDVNKSGRTVD